MQLNNRCLIVVCIVAYLLDVFILVLSFECLLGIFWLLVLSLSFAKFRVAYAFKMFLTFTWFNIEVRKCDIQAIIDNRSAFNKDKILYCTIVYKRLRHGKYATIQFRKLTILFYIKTSYVKQVWQTLTINNEHWYGFATKALQVFF